jgi:hypothetical protein
VTLVIRAVQSPWAARSHALRPVSAGANEELGTLRVEAACDQPVLI